jgi:uncharacterized membrane-anchored protein YhcB (DUF1043 family)
VDYVDSVWQLGIIALVAGAMIGALVYRLLAPSVKQADKTKSELDMAREELNNYKASVNSHFDKTSELVSDLTQNYVKVYQHLAEGAQTLGDSKTLTNLLEQHQGKVLISVDDETNDRDTIGGGGFVDSTVMRETPVEGVDEHAEPFVGTSNDETGSEIPGDDMATSNASKPADGPGQHTEVSQPVFDASKIEEAAGEETAGNAESTASTAANSDAREPEDSPEVKPVTH